jgi:hypothetical protein
MKSNEKKSVLLYQEDNNLDRLDNLSELPEEKAVYGICGRINGEAVNCRYIGETDNLRQSVRNHFGDQEPRECLREFMQSIKLKMLVFELLPDSTPETRLDVVQQWEQEYNPACNAELNQIH